jgi:flagellar biosynthesis regulator FlaF
MYQDIVDKYMANVEFRSQLEERLKEIYSKERSAYGDSKQRLDATIYTSVLWTILATTILFYIFKKM